MTKPFPDRLVPTFDAAGENEPGYIARPLVDDICTRGCYMYAANSIERNDCERHCYILRTIESQSRGVRIALMVALILRGRA